MTSNSGTISYMLFLGALVQGSYASNMTVTVADGPVWTVGPGVAYADLTIALGEHLKFSAASGHDVTLLHTPSSGTTHWSQCDATNGIAGGQKTIIFGVSDFPNDSPTAKYYTPPTCGEYYIACGIGGHCAWGQKIKVTVGDMSSCSAPCANAECVTDGSKPSSVPTGTVHDVKPTPALQAWVNGASYSDLAVAIGDKLTFKTSAGWHDVSTVPNEADYNSCNVGSKTLMAAWTSASAITTACNSAADCCAGSSCGTSGSTVTFTFTATTAGVNYFVCSVGTHCKQGQKIKVTVSPAATDAVSSASQFRAFELSAIFALVTHFIIG